MDRRLLVLHERLKLPVRLVDGLFDVADPVHTLQWWADTRPTSSSIHKSHPAARSARSKSDA